METLKAIKCTTDTGFILSQGKWFHVDRNWLMVHEAALSDGYLRKTNEMVSKGYSSALINLYNTYVP